MTSHTGTETRSTLRSKVQWGIILHTGASLRSCCVYEEGLGLKYFQREEGAAANKSQQLTLPAEEAARQLRAKETASGNTEGASVNRNYWAQSARRRSVKSDVKSRLNSP